LSSAKLSGTLDELLAKLLWRRDPSGKRSAARRTQGGLGHRIKEAISTNQIVKLRQASDALD
jgi:hypothetical protein